MNTSDLIQPRHRERRASIYVRQSSPHQVVSNQESLRLQYGLRQRASELGWPEAEIIDQDLGHSAATTDGRAGFQELVTRIALGEIGILIAYDATRLARNCTHWYQLLDLCGRADCLIADRDGIYDPASINGRLLLGLKGQISELELHTIRARLTAGIVSKAQRGELALMLPTGLVRLDSGQVVLHPDREVHDRVHLVFATLLEKKSLAQTVRYFDQRALEVPRQNGAGEIVWRRATVSNLGAIVKNPAYAGAFVYGRTRTRPAKHSGKSQQTKLPFGQWRVCVKDRYPAYVSWETFARIQLMLRDNHTEYDRNKTRGVPRDGKALLHGIAYCGQCGHKLVVQYKRGTQYLCNYLRQQHGEPVCQRLPADPLDAQAVRWFFEALSAAEIDLAAGVLTEADQQRDRLLIARQQEVERLRYQTRLAERQYQHTDPENRLVAAELERRWEQSLRDLQVAEERLEQETRNAPCWAVPPDLLDMLRDMGPHLSDLWDQRLLATAQKKSLLRALVEKVVLYRAVPDRVHVRLVWRGGAVTEADVPVTVGSLARLSNAQQMQEDLLRLAREGRSDDEIAAWLSARGHRAPRHDRVLPSTVKTIRLHHRVMRRACQSHPRRVPGYLTVPQLADQLNIPRCRIYDRIHNGTIRVTKDASTGCYLFPDDIELLAQFRQLLRGEISDLGC
jgi:DNA invertase Pin-like site-specific DNA recombinase